MEYDEEKDGRRFLALEVVVDGSQIYSNNYFGTKHWDRHEVRYEAVMAGNIYYLAAIGHPRYALAAVDRDLGVVWCSSSQTKTEHIARDFKANPVLPELTDMNSLWAYMIKR